MMKNDPRFASNVLPPLEIGDVAEMDWDEEADVVVVGFGGAGAAVSIEALDLGANVIAIDRFAGGGATNVSGGVTYAGGTRFQKEAGYEDDAGNMYAYLSQEDSAVKPETLRRFCEGSNGDLEWLAANGVPFSSTLYPEKTTYPPEGYFLYFSGNEKTPSYQANARPSPRGHRALGEGFTGISHFGAMKKSALAKGLHLMSHSPARRLITDGDGHVVGVEVAVIPESAWAEHDALYAKIVPMKPFANAKFERAIADCARFEARFTETRRLRARGGVVLAAGGYVFNLEMMHRTRPNVAKVYDSFVRLGSMGCDGSGIDLGQSVGGVTGQTDQFFIGRSIAPPIAFLNGLLVDQDGRRFINEDAYTGFIGNAIADLPGENRAWLVLDRNSFRAALKQCLFPGKGMYLYTLPALLNIFLGGTKRAGSLTKLARKCGLDAGVLTATVAANNAAASGTVPDTCGKAPNNVKAIDRAPYYAINMDLGNKYTATLLFSLGGLQVNEETGAVLRGDGAPVDGLFAAGRTAVGLCSRAYLSGMSIADTVFSGRRAARSAIALQKGADADQSPATISSPGHEARA